MWSQSTTDSMFRQRRWNSELVIADSPEPRSLDSPSARFKSNFAKEVVQDIRQNKQGRFSHPGYMYKTRMELRGTNDYYERREQMQRSRSNCDLVVPIQKSVLIQAEFPNKDDNLAWMSSTTFKAILDKQEVAELGCDSCGPQKPSTNNRPHLGCQEERLDLLRNMMKVKDCLNLDVKEERHWANVCSILEQRKSFILEQGGISQKMIFHVQNENVSLYKEECQRLKDQNELLTSELHRQRKELKAHKNQEKEIERLQSELKSVKSNAKATESVSKRLLSFLEHITMVLESTPPIPTRLVNRIRGEICDITGKPEVRPELKCISNRPSRSSIKQLKHSRSNSMFPVINYSFNESTTNDSSLPMTLDTTGSMYSSPDVKSKKYYENIEMFENIYKETMEEETSFVHSKEKKVLGKSGKSSHNKLGRQTSFKNSKSIHSSSMMMDDSRNMGRQKTHKIMRWFLAKEKSINSTPNKKS